jgi:putative phosphoribosyl transferase
MNSRFQNRHDAGHFLAGKLQAFANRPNVVVLALPRGGVPVGYEVAKALNVPLDVFVVRKLGVPSSPELAMGAIASGGIRVLNEDVIQELGITSQMIDKVAADEAMELKRRETTYRRGREPLAVAGRTVILVDDGLATGASMRAAVQALRHRQPERIIVAVPVGAAATCEQLRTEADEVVCGRHPSDLNAIGFWYEDFRQTTDEEICGLLDQMSPLSTSV